MRQRLVIILTIIVVVVILIVLNALSYVKNEPSVDNELSPDRSTFNSGATGTRGFYDFLHGSGYQVARWRESTSSLLSSSGTKPATFVVVGRPIVGFSKAEIEEVLRWVESGGRLVVVDRNPDLGLLPPSQQWTISTHVWAFPSFDLDPDDFERMTAGVKPIAPLQPTAMALEVESILPSRFAGTITIEPKSPAATRPTPDKKSAESETGSGDTGDDFDSSGEPTPEEPATGPKMAQVPAENESPAPVVHFNTEHGALLIDYPHGAGRIVLLSDPYIVANNGVSRADNLQLAINVVVAGGGLVVFDEYHQGHAVGHNALVQYFQGTPVMAICGQLALIGLAIVWSRGRRFARPLPLPYVDRRSSLEFVGSMAELQQRAKAHDLALENIYGRVRRVLVRHAGMNNASPRAEIAARVATRSGMARAELESLMRKCEETINGAPTNAKETLRLVKRLRQIESSLGLRTRSREEKQAAETL